jgi:hypothetical protein
LGLWGKLDWLVVFAARKSTGGGAVDGP